MTADAAEEAVQRAKAIAARLHQESGMSGVVSDRPTNTGTTAPSGKRRRWGVAPDDAAVAPVDGTTTATTAGSSTVSDTEAIKRPKLVPAMSTNGKGPEKVTKRMWISTSSQRPAAHYVNFMKDELELVPSKLSVEDKDSLVVSLEGRGSGGKQPLAGVPLEPLHVLIEASSQDLISRAELIVDELLQRAEEAPVHPDLISASPDGQSSGAEVKKSVTSTSLALATIQDPSMTRSSNTAYRPASVAQLIGQVNHNGHAGDGTNADWVEETIPVPVGVVGFIIGKGGENIATLQSRTGAKVQVQRETESGLSASATHRNIHVSASKSQALEQAKQLIHNIVQEKSKMLSGQTGWGNMNRKDAMRLEEALAQGHYHLKLPIPDDDVGLVIGKGGSTIRSLQDRTGASIQVPSAQESQDGKRLVHITHPTQQGAEHAQRLITELLQNNNSSSQGSANANNNKTSVGNEPQVSATIMIPDADVGLVIGRQGVVIRYLQDSTRTKIQIPPHCLPGQDHRLSTITGTAQACAAVQGMIAQIIADQSSAGVMAQASPSALGGEGDGNFGNFGVSAQKKSDSQEYSAEWAAYHAAQAAAAAHQTTVTAASPYPANPYYGYAAPYNPYPQQQQWGTQAAGPTAAAQQPPPPPPADAYYEQFFRYAYYYGEVAARQYYGQWSPPPGTPNPYGINPNAIQPAPTIGGSPTGASPPHTTPASTAQPPATEPTAPIISGDANVSNVNKEPTENLPAVMGRETSVRKVSNLPAWMSKSS